MIGRTLALLGLAEADPEGDQRKLALRGLAEADPEGDRAPQKKK